MGCSRRISFSVTFFWRCSVSHSSSCIALGMLFSGAANLVSSSLSRRALRSRKDLWLGSVSLVALELVKYLRCTVLSFTSLLRGSSIFIVAITSSLSGIVGIDSSWLRKSGIESPSRIKPFLISGQWGLRLHVGVWWLGIVVYISTRLILFLGQRKAVLDDLKVIITGEVKSTFGVGGRAIGAV